MQTNVDDAVCIIGAGPAGIAAAIQLKRFDIPFILLEKDRVGGLLWNANLIENYPGFPDGIAGPELVGLLEKHLRQLDIEVKLEKVITLEGDRSGYAVTTREHVYQTRYVLVASGTRASAWDLPIPEELRGLVLTEIWSLADVHNKQIVVVGSGDAAFDYALNLAKRRNLITILNRSRELQCLALLRDRVKLEKSIRYYDNTAIKSLQLDRVSQQISIGCDTDRQPRRFAADYLVLAVGREPQTEFISSDPIPVLEDGSGSGRLQFIGDVRNGRLRQMAIAVGDGLRAAMIINENYRTGDHERNSNRRKS